MARLTKTQVITVRVTTELENKFLKLRKKYKLSATDLLIKLMKDYDKSTV